MDTDLERRNDTSMNEFSFYDSLPGPGDPLLIEASAGTGKTFILTGLVSCYLAQGIASIDQILLLTFARNTSEELAERTYQTLHTTIEVLTGQRAAHNELEHYLLQGSPELRQQRLHRLQCGWMNFDRATITTFHQFCLLVLQSLGSASTIPGDFSLLTDPESLITQVVNDAYLRFSSQTRLPFSATHARLLLRSALSDPQAHLHPVSAPASPQWRTEFIHYCLDQVRQRKDHDHLLDYNDLLGCLASQLSSPTCLIAQRMQSRWPIVLIDEFQDTDGQQWEILYKGFGGHSRMILIGDPKQAIYRFRGGDLYQYLHVAEHINTKKQLRHNWRSDSVLLHALGILLYGTSLGHPHIVVSPVEPCPDNKANRLVDSPRPGAIRLRCLWANSVGYPQDKPLPLSVVRPHICRDLAHDITQLLHSRACWAGRPLRASDIAVLVETHKDAQLCSQALKEAGIAVRYRSDQSIFTSPAANDWLCLLEALISPERLSLINAARHTAFFRHSFDQITHSDDQTCEQITQQIYRWSRQAQQCGLLAVYEDACNRGLFTGLDHDEDPSQMLSDLAQLAQLLTEESYREHWDLTQMRDWLAHQCDRNRNETRYQEKIQISTDRDAVQIMTIFAAKGLQFPLVYLPFLFRRYRSSASIDQPFTYYQPTGDSLPQRCLYLGEHPRNASTEGSKHFEQAWKLYQQDQADEHLRITYVGLTRAQSQIILWWAPSYDEPDSALSRLLRGRTPGDPTVPLRCPSFRSAHQVHRIFSQWHDAGAITLEHIEDCRSFSPTMPQHSLHLECPGRQFLADIDQSWSRQSYSGLISPHHLDPTPGLAEYTDEDKDCHDETDQSDSLSLTPKESLLNMPTGKTFGSLIHAVLETTIPTTTTLEEDLTSQIRRHQRTWPVEICPEDLAQALIPLYHYPLGPLIPGLTLGDLSEHDRLSELTFEFPVGHHNTTEHQHQIFLRDLAHLLCQRLDPYDPFRIWAEHVPGRGLGTQRLYGYLTGSLDLVFRTSDSQYFIVDYKTNYLGHSIDDYSFDHLCATMIESDYPLQAILYLIALHRFLRWRHPHYDPDHHIGGILYLFLRGMNTSYSSYSPERPPGIFSWTPPQGLLEQLSSLLT